MGQVKKWYHINIRGDKVIWRIVILLLIVSALVIYSASSSLAAKYDVSNFHYLLKQIGFAIGGLATLFIFYKIPLGVYRSLAYPAFYISLILLLVTIFFGDEINGARRWLKIGGVSIQTSELVKVTFILYLAKCFENNESLDFKNLLIKVIAPLGVTCILILVGSTSTTLFVAIISAAILWLANVPKKHFIYSCLIAIALLFTAYGVHKVASINGGSGIFPRFDTAENRIINFFSGDLDTGGLTKEQIQKEADKNYQADMARIAISSGGFFLHNGPGRSLQRNNLPHPYSDFVFAIIIEEYGLLVGAFIIFLYLAILYRCVVLISNCTQMFTRITVAGIGLSITLQAFLHMAVNLGIIPVTGHTLPLISLGGTSVIIMCASFGIILSVSRTIDTTTVDKAIEKIAQDNENTIKSDN